ncbi:MULTISPECIES: HNH endonuclease signature motif containing protein [Delftia]|uniref:HNH endonuclease signature motif containing protein n=1 Tax=Delftia TaxID=80865 RepID=UPI000F81FBAE|nr:MULTISPECIES: HNH endonuclease [Delftia]WEL99704.1 HNH endonuclease [Delftia tsuruhatensis]WQM82129.1 HNH endonuclease [Delftia tsuruhatensis]
MNNEVWSLVSGEPTFEVSSLGRVKKLTHRITYKDGRTFIRNERVLNPKPKQGYPAVYLTTRGQVCIHTLVAEAFLGPRPEGARTVNHKDGDKCNNRADNLEWASYAENNRHARLFKLNRQHGERCNLTAFGDDKVDAIRLLWPTRRFTQKELGDLFGMSEGHVYEIVSGKSRRQPTSA